MREGAVARHRPRRARSRSLRLAASPLIVSGYFDGDWVLMVALIVAFSAYAPAHLSRGIASGNGRFNAYAIVMGADGAVRIAFCATLAVLGVKTVGLYGFAVALSPLPGVLWVKARGALRTEPGPESTWAEVTPNLGWLLLGSVFAAALVNAGPLAATLLAKDNEKELVTQFTYGVLLARIPLFLFQAVQAALLPRLSRLAARNEIAEFRSGFARLMKLVLLVGVVGTLGAFVLGPLVIERFYDAKLSRRHDGHARPRQCLLHGRAGHRPGGDRPSRPRARRARLGRRRALTFVVVTWLSSDELFRRVELGLVASSFAGLVRLRLGPAIQVAQRRCALGRFGDGSHQRHAVGDLSDALPAQLRRAFSDSIFRSLATIILTSSGNATSGSQPSSVRAFDASPISRSTSAGRKNFGSWRT